MNVIRDIVIYLTLICLKIGGNNNGIKKSKLRVNKQTILISTLIYYIEENINSFISTSIVLSFLFFL